MRKTSVRKFIHMVIDILPLLIIPIFALNILHKETEPISIEVQEKVSVDFNQIVPVNTLGNVNVNGVRATLNNDNTYNVTGTPNSTTTFQMYLTTRFSIIPNHVYYVRYYIEGEQLGNTNFQVYLRDTIGTSYYVSPIIINTDKDSIRFYLQYAANDTESVDFKVIPQLTDLTIMYGEGNEPSNISDLPLFLTSDYYPYTESEKMLVNEPSPTIYNDTDIGSQFVYALYKPVHDYFNFNNLFNMGAIYNWIELNLFSGTAPLPVFIIWNIIVYEFFVDLIFLLYGVFMFIIDFAEKCLERPFRR